VAKRITIDDQGEDPPRLLVDDYDPKMSSTGQWKLTTPVLDLKDSGLEWITQLDDTIRVYRFTVVLADGSKVVLRQPAMYPVIEKALIRKMLGIDK